MSALLYASHLSACEVIFNISISLSDYYWMLWIQNFGYPRILEWGQLITNLKLGLLCKLWLYRKANLLSFWCGECSYRNLPFCVPNNGTPLRCLKQVVSCTFRACFSTVPFRIHIFNNNFDIITSHVCRFYCKWTINILENPFKTLTKFNIILS